MAFGEDLGGIAFYNSNNVDGKRNRAFILCKQEGATAGEQGSFLTFGTVANTVSVPSERMRIASNGNIGIGTSSPTGIGGGYTAVDIQGSNGGGFNFGPSTAKSFLYADSGGGYLGTSYNAPFIFYTIGTERLRITNAGDLQVAANKAMYCYGSDGKSYGFTNLADGNLSFTSVQFGVKGNFGAFSGVYTATSDINVKKDFEESTIGLAAIMGLKPTLFRYKDDENNELEKDLGFIAQQVKEFIPQAYKESGTFIGLQDRPIIAALVKAVQEQQVQIEELKELIKNK
jgi:hypothetical protein